MVRLDWWGLREVWQLSVACRNLTNTLKFQVRCCVTEPTLPVRRLIRHVAGLLEVVPIDTPQRPDSELVDLIQTARQEIKQSGQVDTGFDVLEHRIKRL